MTRFPAAARKRNPGSSTRVVTPNLTACTIPVWRILLVRRGFSCAKGKGRSMRPALIMVPRRPVSGAGVAKNYALRISYRSSH